jgi:hypothetical protein
MQLPQVAATFANFFETSGNEIASDALATQSFSCAISNAHYRFSFAALNWLSQKAAGGSFLAARGRLRRPAWLRGD